MYLVNMSGRIVVPFTEKVEMIKLETSDSYAIKHGEIEMVYSNHRNIHEVMTRLIRACERGDSIFDFGRALGQTVREREEES